MYIIRRIHLEGDVCIILEEYTSKHICGVWRWKERKLVKAGRLSARISGRDEGKQRSSDRKKQAHSQPLTHDCAAFKVRVLGVGHHVPGFHSLPDILANLSL